MDAIPIRAVPNVSHNKPKALWSRASAALPQGTHPWGSHITGLQDTAKPPGLSCQVQVELYIHSRGSYWGFIFL